MGEVYPHCCSRGPPPKRALMSRPDKIFKESFFRKVEWSRVFVSGPMNPLENPNCFYCQIGRRNVSIYGKGAAKVKRHYASREYFKRDKKWHNTHLRQTDAISGNVSHFVRNKKGELLGKLELELKLPNFINEELVEIGEKLPFYEDFKASRNSVTPGTSRHYTLVSHWRFCVIKWSLCFAPRGVEQGLDIYQPSESLRRFRLG